jgi:hypothetical protein
VRIKEFFKAIRRERRELERMAERVREAEIELLPKAIRYDLNKVQSSPGDPMFAAAAEAEQYRRAMLKMYRRLMERKTKAAQMIDTLEDSRHRQVLQLYVLDGLSMEQTAKSMVYTQRAAYGFYSEAVQILQNRFSEFQ